MKNKMRGSKAAFFRFYTDAQGKRLKPAMVRALITSTDALSGRPGEAWIDVAKKVANFNALKPFQEKKRVTKRATKKSRRTSTPRKATPKRRRKTSKKRGR